MSAQDPVLAVLSACEGKAQPIDGGFKVRCPAHHDKNPSLKVATGQRQFKVDLHCFAGCDIGDVRDALLKRGVPSECLDRNSVASASRNGRRVDHIYQYVDELGTLLYETVRYTPKDFRQRRPDGRGGYVNNLKRVRRVLYRLPAVCEAVKTEQWVVLVEGEKDADRLARDGINATCSPMGAGKWREEYAATLAGAKVAILPDNDDAGRKHAERVVRSLLGVASVVKLVDLPGLPERGDVFDWLESGHTAADLEKAIDVAPARDGAPPSDSTTPSETVATVPPPPVDPPALARNPQILNAFRTAVRRRGVVGEETTACTLYLVLTSRLLDKQVSAAVKGHSSSGKSWTVEKVVEFFPPEAVLEMTAMSEKALVYLKESLEHRTIVLYEAAALREGMEENITAYLVRSLLSEGRIRYPVTVRDKDEGWATKCVEKEGPTNLIVTTTKTQIHAENETRLLSFSTDDSQQQTKRIMAELAAEADDDTDLTEWRQLQAWLQGANCKVTIPFAARLAELVPPVAVRLRRDFGAVLALIRAHAVLHHLSRDRDAKGRIIATLDDYRTVRELVAGVLAEGVGSTVSDTMSETVKAVEELAPTHPDGVPATAVAEKLGLDKSAARRRLVAASDRDYVQNQEDHKGRPGRWVIGESLPHSQDLLPAPGELAMPPTSRPATAGSVESQGIAGGGGAVATDLGGEDLGAHDGWELPEAAREAT